MYLEQTDYRYACERPAWHHRFPAPLALYTIHKEWNASTVVADKRGRIHSCSRYLWRRHLLCDVMMSWQWRIVDRVMARNDNSVCDVKAQVIGQPDKNTNGFHHVWLALTFNFWWIFIASMHHHSHPALSHQPGHIDYSTYVRNGEFRLAIRYSGNALYQYWFAFHSLCIV